MSHESIWTLAIENFYVLCIIFMYYLCYVKHFEISLAPYYHDYIDKIWNQSGNRYKYYNVFIINVYLTIN